MVVVILVVYFHIYSRNEFSTKFEAETLFRFTILNVICVCIMELINRFRVFIVTKLKRCVHLSKIGTGANTIHIYIPFRLGKEK